jgi:hypothetical protein
VPFAETFPQKWTATSDGVWLDVRADISTRGGMDDLISAIEANKPMLRRGAMREVAVADWPTIDGAEPE